MARRLMAVLALVVLLSLAARNAMAGEGAGPTAAPPAVTTPASPTDASVVNQLLDEVRSLRQSFEAYLANELTASVIVEKEDSLRQYGDRLARLQAEFIDAKATVAKNTARLNAPRADDPLPAAEKKDLEDQVAYMTKKADELDPMISELKFEISDLRKEIKDLQARLKMPQ